MRRLITSFLLICFGLCSNWTADAFANAPSFSNASAIQVCGAKAWISDSNGNFLTKVKMATLKATTVRQKSDHLRGPAGLACNSGDLWVADSENNSVTELNSANGDLIRVLGARTDSFDEPVAITYYKTRLWVVNLQGNSVTELNSSTGDLIRVISGPNYRFRGPNAIASGNGRVWITSGQDNSVTEINALSGALIAVFDSPASDFDDPASVITFGGQAWIANAHFPDDSIVKISIAGGALSRLQPKRNDDDGPDCVAINDDKLWVSNSGGIVSEFEAGSGSLIRVVSAREDELRDPVAIAVGGSLVWIANGTYNTVTVLNARSGDLIKVLK